MKYEVIQKEILTAMRANRSQTFVSRRLGFKHNQVYRWESGRVTISWKDFARFSKVCGKNLPLTLKELFNFQGEPGDYAALLQLLIGEIKRKEICKLLGTSAYRLRKWLSGELSPSFVEMLKLFDQFKRQLTDFVFALGVIDNVKSLGDQTSMKMRLLALHRERPYAGILLHAFDLRAYVEMKQHEPGWAASRIGISLEDEIATLECLTTLGLISFKNGKYRTQPTQLHIDSSADFSCFRKTRRYWLQRAIDHIEGMKSPTRDNLFGYLSYSCSESARLAIVEKYSQFLAGVRFIVENDTEDAELVQLLNIQIFDPR